RVQFNYPYNHRKLPPCRIQEKHTTAIFSRISGNDKDTPEHHLLFETTVTEVNLTRNNSASSCTESVPAQAASVQRLTFLTTASQDDVIKQLASSIAMTSKQP
ncbi:hypothetical protein BaRGS_00029245, partial [Batillaria attramentaria]